MRPALLLLWTSACSLSAAALPARPAKAPSAKTRSSLQLPAGSRLDMDSAPLSLLKAPEAATTAPPKTAAPGLPAAPLPAAEDENAAGPAKRVKAARRAAERAAGKILIAFSGGPDAAALAARLKSDGAEVVPVYIDYRQSAGGKTSKDLKHARRSAALLGLPELQVVRAPLKTPAREVPKSHRNRFFVEVLGKLAREKGAHSVALGTYRETYEPGGQWDEESNADLEPANLRATAKPYRVKVLTWDDFGVDRKADEFKGLDARSQSAVEATTSCQMWWKKECGNCTSCVERNAAFKEAFGADPTVYRPDTKANPKAPPAQAAARPGPGFQETAAAFLKAPFLAPSKRAKTFLRSLDARGAREAPLASAALEKAGRELSVEARLFGPLRTSSEKKEHAAYLAVFELAGKPAGLFGYVVKDSKTGVKTGEIHSVYFDKTLVRAEDIAGSLLDFSAALGVELGVKRETLKADYAGRYVWARHGFRFDPDYRYYDIDGKTYKSWELARRSLARFLQAKRIPLKELTLRGKPVSSLEQLSQPEDFALLERRDGRAIRLRPLINEETLGEAVELPLGKAFLLGNSLPGKAPFVLSQGGPRMGTKFAADAMPFWNGYRDLP